VQNYRSWQWILEGFKFDLESSVRPKTVEYYYGHARIFISWVEGNGVKEPELLTKRDINSFFHYIINNLNPLKNNKTVGEQAHHSESLRYHYYRGIKRFIFWLIAEDYLRHNPLDGILVKPPKDPPIEPYSQEQKEKFINLLDGEWKVAKTLRQRMLAARDKAIVCLLFESGLILQEIADLCISDIELNEQRVSVRFGKLGKSRIAGFGSQTKKALWRYLSLRFTKVNSERLWVTEEGKQLASHGIQ
jgi:site-specific recombinase XerC